MPKEMKVAFAILIFLLLLIIAGILLFPRAWHRPVVTDIRLGPLHTNSLRGSFICPAGWLAGIGIDRSPGTGILSLSLTNGDGSLWFTTNVPVEAMQTGNWFGGNSLVFPVFAKHISPRPRPGSNITFEVQLGTASQQAAAWMRFVDDTPRFIDRRRSFNVILSSNEVDAIK
jgi:hypothetical protein